MVTSRRCAQLSRSYLRLFACKRLCKQNLLVCLSTFFSLLAFFFFFFFNFFFIRAFIFLSSSISFYSFTLTFTFTLILRQFRLFVHISGRVNNWANRFVCGRVAMRPESSDQDWPPPPLLKHQRQQHQHPQTKGITWIFEACTRNSLMALNYLWQKRMRKKERQKRLQRQSDLNRQLKTAAAAKAIVLFVTHHVFNFFGYLYFHFCPPTPTDI